MEVVKTRKKQGLQNTRYNGCKPATCDAKQQAHSESFQDINAIRKRIFKMALAIKGIDLRGEKVMITEIYL